MDQVLCDVHKSVNGRRLPPELWGSTLSAALPTGTVGRAADDVEPHSSGGKPCFLKTGTKAGPNQGKSYYICSMGPGKQCNHVLQARLPVSRCLVHEGEVVELQALGTSQTTNEQKRYFRCSKYREMSKGWCGSVVIGKLDNQVDPNKRQALKDRNGVLDPQQRQSEKKLTEKPRNPVNTDPKTTTVAPQSRPSSQSTQAAGSAPATDPASIREPHEAGSGDSGGRPHQAPHAPREPAGESDSRPHDTAGRPASGPKPDRPLAGPAAALRTAAEVDALSESFSSQMDLSGCDDVSAPARSGDAVPGARDSREATKPSASLGESRSSGPSTGGRPTGSLQGPGSQATSKACPDAGSRPTTARPSVATAATQPKPPQAASTTVAARPHGSSSTSAGREPGPNKKPSSASTSSSSSTSSATQQRPLTSGGPAVSAKLAAASSASQPRLAAAPTTTAGTFPSHGAANKQPTLLQSFQNAQQREQTIQAVQRDLLLKHQLLRDLDKQKNVVKSVPLSLLPDKGVRLTQRVAATEAELKKVEARLDKAKISGLLSQRPFGQTQQAFTSASAGAVAQPQPYMAYQMAAQPQMTTLYGGRMTAVRQREVGSITKDAIDKLHQSLQTCPTPDKETDDPKGLKVTLMVHQRQALTWLIWREQQHPCGGILADDMGLGKTLTMIALTLLQKQQAAKSTKPDKAVTKDSNNVIITSQATLVVCPASLMLQWQKEVERRCAPGRLTTCLYHGPNRERDAQKLSAHDLVFTTYNIISKELSFLSDKDKGDEPVEDKPASSLEDGRRQPLLLRICWERIILDEAHNIKNHKSQTAMAICRLRGRSRWAVTGTPIQNNLVDMYSLLRFLRCSPFDEYKVWKRQVDNSSRSGTSRLNILVKSLLLRRTKDQKNLSTGKPLVPLPGKQCHSHSIDLSTDERRVYDKLFTESKSKVQDYIRFHENKDKGPGVLQQAVALSGGAAGGAAGGARQTPQQVRSSHILVSLLRLRQCCGHLSLLKGAVDVESCETEGIDLDLIGQMNELTIDQGVTEEEKNGVCRAEKGASGSAPKTSVFDEVGLSTKISTILATLEKIRRDSPPGRPMKSVIVSQWTRMLDVMAAHLKRAGYEFWSIRGDVPPRKRGEALEDFNSNPGGHPIMLVSLRAGGVGLNLIGGNHLFLLDMHWNPALEDQACDRVYRVGQTNDVSIHKFVCKDTIEERILALQKTKSKLASDVLSGARSQSQKLSLADLRFLFGVN